MTEPLLEVRNLRTCFWTEDGVVRAVDGVSFSIDEGERFGLVGESGSGKSVTAATILRLIDPPLGEVLAGQIMFRGTDLLTLSEKELRDVRGGQIAMIFQDPMTALDPVFTIGAQLIETIKLHRDVNDSEAREIAIGALDDVGIPQPGRRMDAHPHAFSGGMRQRVVIALALVTEPSLLIADEPTTALDVTTQAQTLDLIRKLVDERGMALLLISHDLGVVAGICDRMAVMYAGRLVETATVSELFGKPLHPYTAGLLGSIARLDRARDARLTQIPGSPPSLLAMPQGCSFQARCAYATEVCGTHVPMLVDSTPGHAAACHHAGHLEAAESAEPVPAP